MGHQLVPGLVIAPVGDEKAIPLELKGEIGVLIRVRVKIPGGVPVLKPFWPLAAANAAQAALVFIVNRSSATGAKSPSALRGHFGDGLAWGARGRGHRLPERVGQALRTLC